MKSPLGLLGLAASTLIWPQLTAAQEPAFNSVEVGHWDEPGQDFADIWGEGSFAYLAHNGQRVVSIVDITDPANPVFAARYDALTLSSAQDVKVHDGLMFVGLEGSPAGVQIVDVRDPYAPVKLTDVTVLGSVHNVFYDEGWLYIVDSDTPQVVIVDLRTYDADSAPATISSATWILQNVGERFVHDITAKDGRLYVSAWDSLRIYDVSEIATEEPSLLGFIHGANAHAAWPTDDGRFVVVSEERGAGGLTLYEVIEGVDEVTLETRDYFVVPPESAGSAHNPLIVGNRVFSSYYASGVQVLDIDPVTQTFFPVASFDTSPSDGGDSIFDGCWGVYPFLGQDKVIASDRALGLSVIDFDPNVVHFHETTPVPSTVSTSGGQLQVDLQAVGAPIQDGSVMAQVSFDGAPAISIPMAHQGGRTYTGSLPAATCGGSFEVAFEADNSLGATFTDPPGGATYTIDVTDAPTVIFQDDFSSDLGWTVSNTALSAGAWERGDPVGTGNQPEMDAEGDLTGPCYFTGQGVPGAGAGDADVDGGPTVLTSPVIDHSGGTGVVSYRYWASHSGGGAALVVEISDDGATWVEARRYEGDLRTWNRDSFHIEDFIAPSAQTQIRFIVSDNPNSALVEAAIDSVSVFVLECSSSIFVDGFESGNVDAWAAASP